MADGKFEYRVGWAASSNASFGGESEWYEWDGDEETAEAVEEELSKGTAIPHGLEMALDGSGFEWWGEVREANSGA
jgi:hypothetical protein